MVVALTDAESTGSNNYPAVSVSPADLKLALVFIGEQYTPGASTPPTNFTEVQEGSETLALSYRLPGAAGTYSTSGGTGSVGNNDYKSAHLISVASGATTGLTATAYNPTVKVQVFAQNAAGTGTANNVTAGEAATNAQATNNTAAGTAGNSTAKVDAAGGVAAAAAAGQQPAAKVSAAAGGAAATGTANGVTADVKGQATAATATGAGVKAAGKVDAPSGSAAATGAGLDFPFLDFIRHSSIS